MSASGLTGGKFDKSVPLATDGPGGNQAWQPGDAVKFLPPSDIPTRGAAADAVAALPKDKLLRMYELMTASRKWETAMKDLFLGAKDGLYGAFHTYVGEEAIAVGVDQRVERRRLHREHAPRPRPSHRQGRRSEQDVR